MPNPIRLLITISRAEFLLPNLGSLIMGLAWGVTQAISLTNLFLLIALSFMIINISSAIGAQINTFSDYELDLKDDRKKNLIYALESFGKNRIKTVLLIEFILTLILVIIFMFIRKNPILLLMWMVGISLGWIYSAPPVRLKSRSWLAPLSLILVLGIFPVMFAYLTFTSILQPLFLLALAGLTITIYGVIIPTEIRDYFGDKEMDIDTMTVHLGLVKASIGCMVLISLGGILFASAYLIEWLNGPRPFLSIFLLIIPIAVIFVLSKIRKLYILSKEFMKNSGNDALKDKIIAISADNPKWIMIITQTYSLLSIILLINKFVI